MGREKEYAMIVLPHLSQCDVPQDPILVIKAPVLLGLKV